MEDVCKSLHSLKLNEKLSEVEYHDTYRDEPFLYHVKLLNLLLESCSLSPESLASSASTTSTGKSKKSNTLKESLSGVAKGDFDLDKDIAIRDLREDTNNDGFTDEDFEFDEGADDLDYDEDESPQGKSSAPHASRLTQFPGDAEQTSGIP